MEIQIREDIDDGKAKGKVALISGAASGSELRALLAFASEGAKVVLGDIDATRGGKARCPEICFSGRKTLHHPLKGVMTFEHSSFQATDEPSLRLALRRP